MADYRARRRERLSPENNGEADDLDTPGSSSKLEVGSESRVAARRRERAAAMAADTGSPGEADADSHGAAGGGGAGAGRRAGKDKKSADGSKGGRFAHRKREKRRGTGVVVLQDEDTANATANVKTNTDYNEDIAKKADDHNGTTNSYETPTHRRQATPIRDDESANGSSEVSRIRARRRHARESLDSNNPSSPSSPRSILRRDVDGRSAEEWKRDLEVVDEELDRSREENRALNKAMAQLRS
ncbi:protein CASC3-like isoform X2 [Acanthaster planci]|uniref:Protein CASC3-like isoform X2 n=1 Tax=Acanthaster planci TaxID=133434 RepID=A0A8B7Z919_ACAPL|nr:protein CASC3-like isoform X2 [Acanthaster planci]